MSCKGGASACLGPVPTLSGPCEAAPGPIKEGSVTVEHGGKYARAMGGSRWQADWPDPSQTFADTARGGLVERPSMGDQGSGEPAPGAASAPPTALGPVVAPSDTIAPEPLIAFRTGWAARGSNPAPWD